MGNRIMNKKETSNHKAIPTTLCALSYNDIYDDYDSVNVHLILGGIPTVSVVHHVAKLQFRVAYILGNTEEQIRIIREFCPYLPQKERLKVSKFIKEHYNQVSFIESSTCFYLYALALQNFQQYDASDTELNLCQDEYEAVFKALLYCNQRWTDEQMDGLSNPSDLTEISVRVDLPIVEFKYHKDFKAQVYKAIQFFKFAESDNYYKTILPYFYNDNNVKNWEEYIELIISFYESTFGSHIVTIDSKYADVIKFFDQFIINIHDCTNLWTDYNAITYFRNHFLLKLKADTYLIINPNLLVDKIYQGLKFMFAETIRLHSLPNKKGKPFKGGNLIPDFLSQLGEDFSESHLMYRLFQQIFNGLASVMYTGEELKSKGIQAEPDLYMRIGNVLYLVEHKDLSLGDKYRYSHDYSNIIRPAICERICMYTEKKHKGFGQLLYSMENIFKNGVMDSIDPDVQNVQIVVPIIVTTDRAFSCIGVQRVLIEEGIGMMDMHSIGKKIFISQPIVVDYDILVACGYRLQQGIVNLYEIIDRYLKSNHFNLSPFNTFVMDYYLKQNKFREQDVMFVTNGLFDKISKRSIVY